MANPTYLVPLDLRDSATDVLTAAQALADQTDATLVLLTVIQPISGVYGGLSIAPYAVPNMSFEEDAQRQAKDKLTALATAYGVDQENLLTKVGAPAIEIQEAAKAMEVDLIVMGTHGRQGLARLLGSTANAVLHGLPCDAHLVKIQPAE